MLFFEILVLNKCARWQVGCILSYIDAKLGLGHNIILRRYNLDDETMRHWQSTHHDGTYQPILDYQQSESKII